MALFKHLFDFNGGALAKLRDKRKSKRYAVASGFPLRAAISLVGEDDPKRRLAARGSGRDWAGPIANISSTGLRLHLSPAAASSRGEETVLALALEGFELRIPCKVAHFRAGGTSAVCGVTLDLGDAAARKGYLQLVETLAIGAEFAPAAQGKRSRKDVGPREETYLSGRIGRLVAWREPETEKLTDFELRVSDDCWRGAVGRAGLESEHGGVASAVPGLSEESRRLFRWIVSNLPPAVPADLRELLVKFANDRRDWKPPTPRG